MEAFSSQGRHGQKGGVACGAGHLIVGTGGEPFNGARRGCKFDIIRHKTRGHKVTVLVQPVTLELGQME